MQMYSLMLQIEMVVRGYLNVKKPIDKREIGLRDTVISDVLKRETVLLKWEGIANHIPSKYDSYSIELLKEVIKIWMNVRLHAFAKGWTMKFESKYQKGTCKSLKASASVGK